jgi:hypothetical protein
MMGVVYSECYIEARYAECRDTRKFKRYFAITITNP